MRQRWRLAPIEHGAAVPGITRRSPANASSLQLAIRGVLVEWEERPSIMTARRTRRAVRVLQVDRFRNAFFLTQPIKASQTGLFLKVAVEPLRNTFAWPATIMTHYGVRTHLPSMVLSYRDTWPVSGSASQQFSFHLMFWRGQHTHTHTKRQWHGRSKTFFPDCQKILAGQSVLVR